MKEIFQDFCGQKRNFGIKIRAEKVNGAKKINFKSINIEEI